MICIIVMYIMINQSQANREGVTKAAIPVLRRGI
jgi:hypothetical protein